MCVAHQSEFIQGGVDPLRMDAWLAQKTAYRLGRVRWEMRANES